MNPMGDLFESDPFNGSTPLEIRFSVPPPDPAREALVAEIRVRQERFEAVVDRMIEVYRGFDRTKRADLKAGLKEVYERMKVLGESLGIGRMSLSNLWKG